MNFTEYQTEANKTCSPEFFGEGVNPENFRLALLKAQEACQELDKYKRALFYANREKYAIDEEGTVVIHPTQIDILHSVLGIATETAELIEGYLDNKGTTNLMEEGGDMLWYLALLARGVNIPFEEFGEANIRKLKARYQGQTFTEAQAFQRDLNAETEALWARDGKPLTG